MEIKVRIQLTSVLNDEKTAVRRKECLGHPTILAKTLQMEQVNGRKFMEKNNKVEEFQLANLVSPGSLASNDSEIIILYCWQT